MKCRPVIAATTLIGTAVLLATPGFGQVRQKASPDAAAARSSLLPQLPGKTATPRSTTSEEVPASAMQPLIAPALPFSPPPSPPRSAISK
jgi:hypothetical protein